VIGIVAAAWTGGFGPGVFSTILSLVVIVVVFLEPRMTPRVDEAQHYQSMLIFSLQGLVLAGLGESNLRALRGMSRLASELETRVERRTAQLAMANHQLMDEVHQRTEAERKLQHERNFLAALLESLQDGILACDENREVSLFNRAVREFFGLPPEPVPPQRWAEHYSLYEADGVTPLPPERQPLLRAFEEGQVENAEMVVVARSGRRRVLRVNGRAIHDEGGQRIGAVVSLQDITAQVEAERKVQAALAELRRSNKELQDFASVASHDLQEPLRKIQAFGDRLKATQGERLNDQGRDYLERMHNAAYRMGVLINDLLAFSRVTTRAQPFATVDLSQVAREVLGDLEDRLERTQGRVELGPLPAIEADPTQMRQLIQNLLSNALKFHKPGVPPVVHLREAPLEAAEADWVAIEVSDNGIGFEEKYLDRIFGIFQRLHGRGEYEGTGVGLAVCRKIVERHGGRITARSAPGAGTTFTVTLPRRPSNHPHEQPQAHYDPAGR
jgi:PAS domain S-box-containing protein